MSTKPTVAGLPGGGGAYQGIGEKFAMDLFTGTGNFSIPITLPAGRNGMQPELNLSYSTGAGNNVFGMGWNIGFPSVSRKTSKGIPLYRDNTGDIHKDDTFLLSGSEDLVPTAQLAGDIRRYRPRTEGLFALVDQFQSGTGHWKVQAKDGITSFYGTPRPADAAPDWTDPAVIADPADRSKVFCWMLTRTQDPLGNHIVYEYERDSVQENDRHWDQLYISRIRYVDHDNGLPGTAYLISVRFNYEDRPDPFSRYRSGFEIRTRRRCASIDVFSHAPAEQLTRRYHFIYFDQLGDPGESMPNNRVSLLSRIKVTGHDGDRVEEMPAIDCDYRKFEPEKRNFFPLEGRDMPLQSLANPTLEMVDLFGTGLPDLLQLDGAARYWRNLGNGRYDLPRFMKDAPAGIQLDDPGVQMIDADGDGRTDLMVSNTTLTGYFPLRFGGEWDRRSFQPYSVAPSFNFEDPDVRLLDLSGNGVTDAMRSGARFEYFFNDPEQGWNSVRMIERRGIEEFPNVNFSDQRVRLADISGDGLQDIVLVHDGNINYWPNLGHGNWGKRIEMRNSPRFPADYDIRRVLLGDIDGDGLTDIIYVDHMRVLLYLNQSGNSWSDAIEIDGTPEVSGNDVIRLADILGKGIAGILWSKEVPAGTKRMFFLDLAKEGNPYLIREVSNNMGSVTRVRYLPSTHYYLEDQKHVSTRWKTPLPFPVNVVASVEMIDEISKGKLTTEYTYHHGYWDGTEREFRGFGRVDQRDTEIFDDYNAQGLHGNMLFDTVSQAAFTPPVETRSWFHQGAVGDVFSGFTETDFSNEYFPGDPDMLERPQEDILMLRTLPAKHRRDALRTLRGTILRTEVYALDGSNLQDRPYTVQEGVFSVRQEPPGLPGTPLIFFPHARAQRVTQWERGDEPMTQVTFTGDYDEFGQARDKIDISCPRGWRNMQQVISAATPFLAMRSQTVLAHASSDTYIKDRVAKSSVFSIKHEGERMLNDIRNDALDPASLELVSQQLHYYDGPAFEGLPSGDAGRFGMITRTEILMLTEAIIQQAYGSEQMAPYLTTGATVNWTSEYPQRFRQELPEKLGYVFHDGSGPQARGFYINKNLTKYDFHLSPSGKGLPVVQRDPLGKENLIEYDKFGLFQIAITDPARLRRTIVNDYRVFQPVLSTDINGNQTEFSYTPLGYIESIAMMGKPGENVGDTPEVPGKRIEYELMAFQDSAPEARQPAHIRTITREYNVQDTSVPAAVKDNTLINVEYMDGFGRIIQKRTQAEDIMFGDVHFGGNVIPGDLSVTPGPSTGRVRNPADPFNVKVNGWQVYNNKGLLVNQYESFFSTGFAFSLPEEAQLGQKSEMHYDPRGNVIKVINPNSSLKRVVYGIPRTLDNPEDFIPTPWEAYTYDSNDLAPAFTGDHRVDPSHWHTPASVEVDAMGRVVKSISHLGSAPADKLMISSLYDNTGNMVRQTDALGRTVFTAVYDLGKLTSNVHLLREDNIDAGKRCMVYDAVDAAVERRSGKGSVILQLHDEISRPTLMWARNNATLPMTLRQKLIYGDRAGLAHPEANNLNGKLFHHFDEAGLQEKLSYDFKNTMLHQTRRFISDQVILSAPDFSTFQVDWDTLDPQSSLDPKVYEIDISMDAMKRPQRITCPRDIENDRKVLQFEYERGGAARTINLLSANGSQTRTVIQHMSYNSRGQRSFIAYGNGVMSRYAYDSATSRITRLRAEKFREEGDFNFVPDGGLLQDIGYDYDLSGNIKVMRHRSPGAGIPNTPLGADALDEEYSYDALYRLVFASGREHNSKTNSGSPWLDAMGVTNNDVTQVRGYEERYQYDNAHNLVGLQHAAAGAGGSFSQQHILQDNNNRLARSIQGAAVFEYEYDVNGNMITEAGSRNFIWNHIDQLQSFKTQLGTGTPSAEAIYLYDAGGQRAKKLVRRQGGKTETSIYIGALMEAHTEDSQTNNIIGITDENGRIAELRIGNAFSNDESPAFVFHLANHLSSTVLSMDENGSFIKKEFYYPFGGTSFGSYRRKRQRYTGKEADDESGLRYHGARYYAPWLMRWMNPDPAGRMDGLNLYRYARNNPMCFHDPSGTNAIPMPGDAPGTELGLMAGASSTTNASAAASTGDKGNWLTRAASAVGGALKTAGIATYRFEKKWLFDKPWEWTMKSMGIMWNKTKEYAGNIWGWAKSHKWLAIGIAIGVVLLSIFFGKFIWNWIIAPAARITSNAVLGYVIGSEFGPTGGMIGAILGGGLGAYHGLAMAKAGTYKGIGLLYFLFDNSWSLMNSAVGSLFAAANMGWNDIDKSTSKSYGGLFYETAWSDDYNTTLGNTTVGVDSDINKHETVHAIQARLLGPVYLGAAIVNYQINVMLPWWTVLGYNDDDCDPSSAKGFFTGVYRNTWHELIAYGIQGDKCE